MTLLSQSLLTFVSGHLVTLLFLSVWHSLNNLNVIINMINVFIIHLSF